MRQNVHILFRNGYSDSNQKSLIRLLMFAVKNTFNLGILQNGNKYMYNNFAINSVWRLKLPLRVDQRMKMPHDYITKLRVAMPFAFKRDWSRVVSIVFGCKNEPKHVVLCQHPSFREQCRCFCDMASGLMYILLLQTPV